MRFTSTGLADSSFTTELSSETEAGLLSSSRATDVVSLVNIEKQEELESLSLVAKQLLSSIVGEDPDRDGLKDTPLRFAKAFEELTSGYTVVIEDEVGSAIFSEPHEETVLLQKIPLFSLCEHHMLPFFGDVSIAYVPDPKVGVIGLSKFKRIVDIYAKRLQVQERLTVEIMEAVVRILRPLGVAVIMECRHMCMEMRGVKSQGITTITKATCGVFRAPHKFAEVCLLLGMESPQRSVLAQTVASPEPKRQAICSCSVNDDKGCLVDQPIPLPKDCDDYRLYQQCAKNEAANIATLVQDAVFGPLTKNKTGGLSVLDIGAGNGANLRAMCHQTVGELVVAQYTAFEKNESLCDELRSTVTSLGFDATSSFIVSDQFDLSTTVEGTGGKFDIVLICHSLYGNEKKEELINHAMHFISPGGVIIIAHKWAPGGTLDKLCDHFTSRNILYHFRIWDEEIDLSGFNESERLRLGRYTKTTIPDKQTSFTRPMGCIAIELFSGNLGCIAGRSTAIVEAKGQVSFLARKKTPAAVIKPNTVAGVQACLRAASLNSIGDGSITVVGGGHSENAFANDAIAINLQLWKHVEVDTCRRLVRAGGGTKIGMITSECEKHGLVVPLGDRPGVGVGLILQGGLNHFMRAFGLATDNIVSLVYVSPTGELKEAKSDDELFPFRGAGSNFGVVLELVLQAFPLKSVQAQDVIYALKENVGTYVATVYSRVAEALPERQCLDAFIFWSDHDQLSLATSFFDSTDKTGTENQYEPQVPVLPLGNIADTILFQGNLSTYTPSQLYDRELYMTSAFSPDKVLSSSLDGHLSPPQMKLRSMKRCVLLPSLLSPVHNSILVSAVRNAPSKWSYIHLLHGGGAVSQVPPTKNAFGCRNWSFNAVITARWADGDAKMETKAMKWIEDTMTTILPHSVGIYGADLGPQDSQLSRFAFGPNSLRLADNKRAVDPLNVLRHACPLLGDNDPRVQSRGMVVIFCGRRCVGKDWLAQIVARTLGDLIGSVSHQNNKNHITMASISEALKRDYAKENPSVDLEKLLGNHRPYKESHRTRLHAFYNKKRAQDPAYDASCYINVIQNANRPPQDDGILLLTGLRDGLEYARSLAGKPVVLVKVESSDDVKTSRGSWTYDQEVDKSRGECAADQKDESFWDLIYVNDKKSTTLTAESWARDQLVPCILKNCTRHLCNTPQPGVVYQDILGGLLLQPFAMPLCTSLVVAWLQRTGLLGANMNSSRCATCIDVILAPEALGFVFAGALATAIGKPLVLARKPSKIPGDVQGASYSGSNMQRLLECGNGSSFSDNSSSNVPTAPPPATATTAKKQQECNLEIVAGALQPGQRVLLLDDCLASGSTLSALSCLVGLCGGVVEGITCFMEFPDLNGRNHIVQDQVETCKGVKIYTLVKFPGK